MPRSRSNVRRPPGAATLAYVHDTRVSYSWHQSVQDMVAWDLTHEGRLIRGGRIAMRCGTGGLVGARNAVAKGFLDETDSEWLFWTDTDMGFEGDSLDRLLAVADPKGAPIVGGLCYAWRERVPDGMGGYRSAAAPTIFDWVKVEGGTVKGYQSRNSYPVNTMMRCGGTGSAFIVIHRSVLERVREEAGDAWYDQLRNPDTGDLISEDLSFCMRATALDFPVHVHTGIRATHHKELWVGEPDFWRQAVAPPAPEEVAVLVPVMRRPQNAEPFMRSLRASTGMATAYPIADREDVATIKAWRDAGATVLYRQGPGSGAEHGDEPRPGTFAEKVNEGFAQTVEPWVFICGDDVRFRAGWLDHAEAMSDEHHHVVGTNDLVNRRVTRGEHATHILLRRSYVEERGGGWDGPGVLAHEGYRHWFVDDEIVTAAKQRGVWSMALGSIVEHMHPLFGRAPDDEVYRLGQSAAAQDKERFAARLRHQVRQTVRA